VFVPSNIGITGGPAAWFGWPDVPKLDALRAATPEEQKKLAADIQVRLFRDMTHVPLGQFFQPAAFHKGLVDIRPGWPVRHSVRRA
jgi:peptide/nickel transport system substrate-binding protein